MIKASVMVNSNEHIVFNGMTKEAFKDGYLYVVEGLPIFILAKPMMASEGNLYTGIKKAVLELRKTSIKFTKPMQKVFLTPENSITDVVDPKNIFIGYCLEDKGNFIDMLMA